MVWFSYPCPPLGRKKSLPDMLNERLTLGLARVLGCRYAQHDWLRRVALAVRHTPERWCWRIWSCDGVSDCPRYWCSNYVLRWRCCRAEHFWVVTPV